MSNRKEDHCFVCDQNTTKYACPRCHVKTCSLQCTKVHKLEMKCDGIRENYRFVMLDSFDNIQLLNDYRFLENSSREFNSSSSNYDQVYNHFISGSVGNKRRKRHRSKVGRHVSK